MPEPIDLATAKQHLRVLHGQEDALITALIVAAREWVENFTGQVLVQREVTQRFDGFTGLALNAWPIADDAVAVISYVGSDGGLLAVDDARMVLGNVSAQIAPAIGSNWPTSYGPVTVTVEAGYATPEDVPQSLKQAMLLLIGHWYNNREAVSERSTNEVPFAVEALCMPYRTRLIG